MREYNRYRYAASCVERTPYTKSEDKYAKTFGACHNRARRVWIYHNGPIPLDEHGNTYVIHHKDGDWTNNDISNLEALPRGKHQSDHMQGWKPSEEMRKNSGKKTSERNKQATGGKNPFAQAVRCIETGVIYETIKQASIDTGASPYCIRNGGSRNSQYTFEYL